MFLELVVGAPFELDLSEAKEAAPNDKWDLAFGPSMTNAVLDNGCNMAYC